MIRSMSAFIAFIVGMVGLAVWALLVIADASSALRGWLIGFVFISSLTLGSLAVVLIHRLTGGKWGAAFAPELEPVARATPILCAFVLPILIGLPLIYRWAAQPSALDDEVRHWYLNPPFFVVRTASCLIGWSVIAWMLPRIEGRGGRLGAGLGLAFHGVALSIMSVDWILSVRPSWTSSDFPMDLAVQQLACAFAWAGLQGRKRAPESPAGDISGLLYATIIGLTYLEFMSYLVVWYGDRPALDAWYIARVRGPWQVMAWASLAFGALAVVLLTIRRRFGTHRAVAMVGGSVLAGVLCYETWLLAPAFGASCLMPGLFALIAQGGVWVALIGGLPRFAQKLEGMVHAH